MGHRSILLVVDDETRNRALLRGFLGAQYEVIEASSGREAVEAVRRSPVDLVLLDVMMPDQDGFSVCRQLKGIVDDLFLPVLFYRVRRRRWERLHDATRPERTAHPSPPPQGGREEDGSSRLVPSPPEGED